MKEADKADPLLAKLMRSISISEGQKWVPSVFAYGRSNFLQAAPDSGLRGQGLGQE